MQGKPHVKVPRAVKEKLIAPEEISVEILKEIKSAAEVSYCVKFQNLTLHRKLRYQVH